jgi:hypothetical protein
MTRIHPKHSNPVNPSKLPITTPLPYKKPNYTPGDGWKKWDARQVAYEIEQAKLHNVIKNKAVGLERSVADGVKKGLGWLAFRIKDAMEPQRYD